MIEGDIHVMRQGNLELSKKLAKSLKYRFSIIEDTFESSLKQMEFYDLTMPNSRDWVRLN